MIRPRIIPARHVPDVAPPWDRQRITRLPADDNLYVLDGGGRRWDLGTWIGYTIAYEGPFKRVALRSWLSGEVWWAV